LGSFTSWTRRGGELTLTAWGTETKTFCDVPDLESHYAIGQAGIWVDCIANREPLVVNDYATVTGKQGLPPGHNPIDRFVSVPLFEGDRIVAIIGVGNKASPYGDADVSALREFGREFLANLSRQHHIDRQNELMDQLENKKSDIQRLLYVTSHDLKAPLLNIQGFCGELRAGLGELREALQGAVIGDELSREVNRILDADLDESMGYILKNVEKMDALLQALLRLSRESRKELSIEVLPMGDLVRTTVASFSSRVSLAGATIKVEPLPDMHGDREQVERVFANLIDNGISYRSPDRPLEIVISGRKERHYRVYEVRDNGIGIEEEHLAKIFDMYHRLNPRDSDGDGIGLNVVKMIVEKHKGRVEAESSPGEGSVFRVRFPSTQML
jgi:signal transduction histidine kinase